MRNKIAFIGVGNMATATLTGITSDASSSVSWENIILFNRHPEKIESYRNYGAHIACSLKEAVELADCIFLCVKPQNFPEILPELKNCKDVAHKLFVSLAAGINTATVSDAALGAPVVRAMPNTPMLIGKGVIAVCRNEKTSDEDFDFACDIFRSSGSVICLKEDEMNRIICVTGSSPAYVFLLIKAMYNGAVSQNLLSDNSECGLSKQELINSICDTIIGAAELMKTGAKTPDEQITTVASKGGTTERAIAELHKNRFCESIESAMLECTKRADELSLSKS